MGNPLGLQSSVTEGIVSALGRQVSEPAGNALPDAIQTSAAINPGNSGGALVDLNGQVVGIPTLEATDPQLGGAAGGIGFAISSNRAMFIANQLIAGGKVTNSGRAYLGVQLRDGINGPFIVAVTAGGHGRDQGRRHRPRHRLHSDARQRDTHRRGCRPPSGRHGPDQGSAPGRQHELVRRDTRATSQLTGGSGRATDRL
jgi:hypothetical protein